jgi:hypothetical protein
MRRSFLFEDKGTPVETALPVMKHDVPSRALATTSSCSSLSFAFVLRILASILCNCDAPNEPMRCVSSRFAPSGRFFSAPRRMRSATETLAFFLRGGRILWVNLSILSFVRGAALRYGLRWRFVARLRCGGVRALNLAYGAQQWARGRGTLRMQLVALLGCPAPHLCRPQ